MLRRLFFLAICAAIAANGIVQAKEIPEQPQQQKAKRHLKKKTASVNKKTRQMELRPAMPDAETYTWQIDAGIQSSSFSRVPQQSWNQEFLQVTRFFNNRETAIHAKATRYEQFSNIDDEYEIGIDRRFSQKLYGRLYISGSPDPVFRPDWRLDGGGGLRLSHDKAPVPLWATLDVRHDVYPIADIETVNPGLKIEPLDNWSLASRLITVSQPDAATIYGWDARLDGQIEEGKRFYIGYADAPETVAAVTVQTRTIFGGLALDVTPAYTLRLGYAHDDRENSYIRHVIDVSLSYKF
jgi:YaiO family outer membrane protein